MPPRGCAGFCTALLLSLTLTLASIPAGAQHPDEDGLLSDQAALMLARAISIRSVNPPGREAALARFYVEVLRREGLEARVVETPAEPRTGPRAAAWARLRGAGDARPVVLLSHLDVVPANPSEWRGPPFEGRIEGSDVLGRGALDAKGVSVIHLLTIAELARRSEPLARDVIFLATPDEESGGRRGAGWLVAEHPELLGNAEFLLTEGGSVRVHPDGTPVWGITVTEKSPCWLELSVRGAPGHSSAPARDAAVPRLVAALDAVRRIETRVRVLPVVERMFAALADTVHPDSRAVLRDIARALDEDPAFRRRFLSNPGQAALVRDTISLTVLEGGARTNVAPAVARAHVDARLLPGRSCDDFAKRLAEVIDDPGVRIEILLAFPSNESPIDTALYRAVEAVALRDDPGAVVVPRMIAGFTDAHWFREVGIVAYGFVPRWLAAEDTRGIHGVDERVSIQNLVRGTRTQVAILEALSAGD